MTIIAKTPRWLPLVAVALVAYSIAGVIVSARRHREAPRPDGGGAVVDTASLDSIAGDCAVHNALAQIPPDSVEIKRGWRDTVPGIDLAALAPATRERFLRYANSEDCTCGCGYTLAACRNFDATCPVSLPRVEGLRDSVVRGLVADAQWLRERPPPEHP